MGLLEEVGVGRDGEWREGEHVHGRDVVGVVLEPVDLLLLAVEEGEAWAQGGVGVVVGVEVEVVEALEVDELVGVLVERGGGGG